MTFLARAFIASAKDDDVAFFEYTFMWSENENSILLSRLVAENPAVADFWSLERCVSAAARTFPEDQRMELRFDVEPEFRGTPGKWQAILTAAYERGLRARPSGNDF